MENHNADSAMNRNNTHWWKKSVIYQVYPRSFQDSNEDGIGDIRGIISRLDYLKDLGVDAIWLSPVYCSPQDDNGYDISDYQNIDPMFGTLEDMELLIAEGKKRGIGMIMDLVLNHSSDEHRWFIEAKKSRENPYHDYYVWRDGEEGIYPNDMKACFGGSAWEWVPELKQYYFHQFSVKQPDLNWDNPKVRQEIYDMINWWIDKGVAGFRLDVIDQIAKEPDRFITANGPRLHEYIRELSTRTFSRADLLTVGEAWGADVERAKLYSNPDGSEFSMVFQFEHSVLDQQDGMEKWDLFPLDLLRLKEVFAKWQTGLHGCGWNSLFWDNHDLPRIVSRWGDDSSEGNRVHSAKMLATVLHGLEGTPFIYQGEELGMTNASSFTLDQYKDIESVNASKERLARGYSAEEVLRSLHAKSRDNARTPMQWTADENAGFTAGKPWIDLNANYTAINAASQQDDPESIFTYYKKLVAARKAHPVFAEGNFTMLAPEDPDLFAYIRQTADETLLVLANFHGSTTHYSLPDSIAEKTRELLSGEIIENAGNCESSDSIGIIVHNYPDTTYGTLQPYEALMFII